MSRNVPKYSHHKGTGQARVRINGKDTYLGVFGSPESHRRYAEVIEKWQRGTDDVPTEMTVGQLTMVYKQFCKRHYIKNGELTSEVSAIKIALRHLNKVSRKTLAKEFSPKMLKRVQQSMVEAEYVRTSINQYIGRIKRMFKYAVSEELVPVTTYTALETVQGLQKGRCEAPESPGVKPVPQAFIDAVKPFVSVPVWGMIQLQLATGMRPGEVRILRACDLLTSGKVWEYVPASHKTEHHGKERRIMIGPAGQAILKDFLNPDTQAYLFSPKDTKARRAGEIYTKYSYGRAIANACKVAEIPNWTPNQLRHNFGTMARKEFGIEAARVTLGHSSAVTSEIYSEIDFDSAREIVAKIG